MIPRGPTPCADFEYRKTDGSFVKLDEMTPQELYKSYGGIDSSDYCCIHRRYMPQDLLEIFDGTPDKLLPGALF